MRPDHKLYLTLAIVSGGVVAFGAVVIPALGQPRCKHTREIQRQVSLRTLSQATLIYAADHNDTMLSMDMWPAGLAAWLGVSHETDDVFFFPGLDGEFVYHIYVGPPAPTFDAVPEHINLPTVPMFYEHPSLTPERTSVAFWDGSVRSIKDRDFLDTFANVANPDGTPYIPVGLDAIEPD